MSYKLTSPLELINAQPTSLKFNNTSEAIKWELGTDVSNNFVLNNTTQNGIIKVNPTTYQLSFLTSPLFQNGVTFQKGSKNITIDAPTPINTSYSLIYPPDPPTTNQILSYTGSAGTWTDLYTNVKNQVVVNQNPNPGEFSSIRDAVNSIPTVGPDAPSDINRYVVYVYEGVYSETATIVVPSDVFIVGISMEAITVTPSSSGYNLFEMSLRTGLAFFTIKDVPSTHNAIYFKDVGDYALIHKIEIEGCEKGVLCDSQTQDSFIYLEYTGISNAIQYAVKCTDNGSGFKCSTSVENFFTFGHSDDAIIVDGPNAIFLIQATVLQEGDTFGNGIRLLTARNLV